MSFTTDPTTSVGLVRLRIFDRDPTNPVFSDEDIQSVYTNLERQSVKRTAAFMLETIASKELLILKVMKNLSLQTDGAAVARELRMEADKLRDQADIEDTFNEDAFDWADQVFDEFGYREHLVNEILRNA